MKITVNQAIDNIEAEIVDAKRMLSKIQFDPKRKLDQPCEKLHYLDGRIIGLGIALQYVKNCKEVK